MKNNLSSQIKLDRIPRRLYDPQSEIELTALTREEKVFTRIFETVDDGSNFLADCVVRYIKRNIDKKGKCVLALGAGQSTLSVYARLIELYKQGCVSFRDVIVFNTSEFFPIVENGPSTLQRLREVLLDHIDILPENIHSIDAAVTKENMFDFCKAYEKSIEDAGGIDVTLCEIGRPGSLAFNEPGSAPTSLCRLVLLGNEMRQNIAADYKCEHVPTTAITLGIANLLSANRVLTMAWGENRAEIIKKTVEELPDNNVPSSWLQTHPHAKIAIDLSAAEDLTRISQPWKVTSCEWTDKLTRRAIVWLSHMTGKPILKLTDKDYNDWGLGELLAVFGSAY
ncbi:MAG: 6-phosphogluconolactonase, partial [Paramuribaculum sp.]|nr:6-phosphogluconolactonase [Paramuribaculum sp.]